MSSLTSSDKASPPQSRQKPGSACEECRRRKLRCDRQQPRCRFCSESSVVCTFTSSRPPRGPKKGHLKVLQARIGTTPSSNGKLTGCHANVEMLRQRHSRDASINSRTMKDSWILPMRPWQMGSKSKTKPTSQSPFIATTLRPLRKTHCRA